MYGHLPGGMIPVGQYAIPPSPDAYTREVKDYVNGPLPSQITPLNLNNVISAIDVRIKQKKEIIDPNILEGIGKPIERIRPENDGLPPTIFEACYGGTLAQINGIFVPYVKTKVNSLENAVNETVEVRQKIVQEIAKIFKIVRTYFPELNQKLQKAYERFISLQKIRLMDDILTNNTQL